MQDLVLKTLTLIDELNHSKLGRYEGRSPQIFSRATALTSRDPAQRIPMIVAMVCRPLALLQTDRSRFPATTQPVTLQQ